MRLCRFRLLLGVLTPLLAACVPPAAVTVAPPKTSFTFNGSRVRSFTDSHSVQSIADGGTVIAMGGRNGVLRWDVRYGKYALVATAAAGAKPPRYSAVAVDAHHVIWAAGANDLVRIDGDGAKIERLPKAPVGPFVSALLAFDDDRLWAGGPEGLARLNRGIWEATLIDTAVTALSIGQAGVLWVGTGGRGVMRISKSGDRIEHFGGPQGCEIDVVRGMAVSDLGVVVVGESSSGPRLAFFDGERFHTYRTDGPAPPTWAARAAASLFVGNAHNYFEVRVETNNKPAATGVTRPPAIAGTTLDPVAVPFNLGTTGAAIDKAPPPATTQPAPNGRAPAPIVDLIMQPLALPDGLTAIASSNAGLLIGTRFLGALRIENGVPRQFRAGNLLRLAERLSVACTSAAGDECYIATGGPRAYRFDGEAFEAAPIDNEENSAVLAVLSDTRNQVIALHRGPKDRALRISIVNNGRWTPVTFQPIEVPAGVVDISFARFSPSGKLWVGLRYTDTDGDQRGYGAAEIDLQSGKVAYHGRAAKNAEIAIPDDVNEMFFLSNADAWLATRAGAIHMVDKDLTEYTENEGLKTEFILDIAPGPNREVWVATKSGAGRYDGKSWVFPRIGAFYPPASSLAVDGRGEIFIGTDKGLYCQGSCRERPFTVAEGLLDNNVLDVDVDARGRAWVLTKTGLTIVDP